MSSPSIDQRVLGCVPGNYPWDQLERAAIEAGIAADLAGMIRALMREAYNHSWSTKLRNECGLGDEGAALIARARSAPAKLEERIRWLIETDGERVRPDTMEWLGEGHPAWPKHRRAWALARRKQQAPGV